MQALRKWRENMPYVISHGARIHYETVGHGPPTVLAHGGTGNSSMWKLAGYLDNLSGYCSILIDRRGHGLSETPRDAAECGMDQHVADVVAVLDALHIERVAYWGFSAGGSVGFAFVARHPDRVSAFIAAGTDSKPYSEQSVQRLLETDPLNALQSFDENEEGVPAPPWLKEMPRSDRDVYLRDYQAYISDCSACLKWEGEEDALPRINIPTLIICGSKEDPDRESEAEAQRLQNGRAVILEGFGHLGAFLRSDLSLPAVKAFLKEVGIEPDPS
ncbi:MAG TPA: alpha/beta hydrolase [Euryarchaeota archaeon]|nr:alpha/beta hydrolase [Euryarchaeota archaeon]